MGMACGWLYLPDSTNRFAKRKPEGTAFLAILIAAAFFFATTIPIDFNGRYWLARGFALESQGLHDEAIALYEKQLQRKPDDPAPLAYRAFSKYRQGKYEEAIEDSSKALAAKESEWILPTRTDAYIQCGQYAYAVRDFKKLIAKHDQSELQYRVKLAKTYWLMDKDEQALEELEKIIQESPNYIEASTLRAYIWQDSGQIDDALKELKYMKGCQPIDPKEVWYCQREYVRYSLADYKGAIEDAERVMQFSSDYKVYAPIVKYLANQRLSNQSALTQLEQDTSSIQSDAWPYPVLIYLQGKMSAEELFKLATDNDRLTEAKTYVGMNLHVKNDKSSIEMLNWVVKNGNKSFLEYTLARSELAKK
jgi:tetratricopeptide (TPR) repeat protein